MEYKSVPVNTCRTRGLIDHHFYLTFSVIKPFLLKKLLILPIQH